MIAIQVIQDRFSQSQSDRATKEKTWKNSRTVRRPVRGTVLKEDTFATMRVVTGKGENILLTDAGGKEGSPTHRQTKVYSNFLLQNVSEERMEKQQILETFGEPYIFLFGERPRMLTFSGILLNTFDFNWEAEWWDNYERYLRGTRCVEQDARVFLAYDETLVSGYIIAAASAKNAQERNHVSFQFTMFLTGYTNFSAIGDGTAIPLRARELAIKANALQQVSDGVYQVQAPKTLISGEVLTGQFEIGVAPQPTLVDGLRTGLSTVINTWNRAQAMVTTAEQNLSNLARGDVIRVPFGFTGSFAYDAADLVRPQVVPINAYGPLKYSEFKDNKDEYIGTSSHYGSSFIPVLLGQDQFSIIANQNLVNECRSVWEELGFDSPLSDLAAISGPIISGQLGMFVAGNTAAWQVAQAADQGLSALNLSDPTNAVRSIPVPPVFG